MADKQYEDSEVLGLDTDGCVIQWDASKGESYNCGESLEDWGIHNLRPHEIVRVGVTPEQLAKAIAEHDALQAA